MPAEATEILIKAAETLNEIPGTQSGISTMNFELLFY